MKSAVVVAAAIAQLAAGQATLNYDQITNAAAPTATAPPQVASIDSAAIQASLSSVLTAVEASYTGVPAKFRLKREAVPTFGKPKPIGGTNPFDPVDEFCYFFPWKCSKPEPEPQPEPSKPQPGKPSKPTTTYHPTPTDNPAPPPKDDKCNAQPMGAGPAVQPDTAEAFTSFPGFSAAANAAQTPSGYKQVFKNLNAAYSGYSYITYTNLNSYDPKACADACDAYKGCSSFNVYFERDPTLAPGPNCPNPPSTTNIRCALWGSAIDADGATNNGEYREKFHVVITGSNGYTKPGAPIDVPPYYPPEKCPNGAIGDKGKPWFLADHFFPGFFAPELCKVFAEIQLEKNKADSIAKKLDHYSPINGYNVFELWEEGKMIGTYCKLYTEPLPVGYADYKGETKLERLWEVKNAWFYKLLNKDFGKF
ncbi:uncharacterized protein RCC_05951 [Ramularia collo-cygni]|uniref:Apple domain-containing protein n=1 Tax=Ramularia collo-cygni TaxID=112498 RepID=A0A2D3VBK7_9PEZI|nr:uncharacterized protein RCC_05951 [Ramularia collo-cygni]CZT20094.1 uncharacterized protein RCC_05951 [Ramularia collo-cygni]